MSGVEMEILSLAQKSKKEIKGLETIDFQMSIFDSIPYDVQAKSLLRSVDSLQQSKKYFDTLVNVYLSQDLNAIEAMFSKPEFGMADNLDILLDKRNENWAMQFKTLLPKGPLFIAVGAGHLVGEKGILALLKKQGYQVTPLLNK